MTCKLPHAPNALDSGNADSGGVAAAAASPDIQLRGPDLAESQHTKSVFRLKKGHFSTKKTEYFRVTRIPSTRRVRVVVLEFTRF